MVSQTIEYATWFCPSPPYSSGTVSARNPCSPSSSRFRRGNFSSSSERFALSRISCWHSSISVDRSSFCRSVSSQSGSQSYPRPQYGSEPHIFSSLNPDPFCLIGNHDSGRRLPALHVAESTPETCRAKGGTGTAGAGTAELPALRQPDDLAVGVQIDPRGRRVRRQPGHGPHLAADRVDEPGADRGADLPHRQRPAGRRALERGIRRDGQVRLGDADRQRAEPGLFIGVELLAGLRRVLHAVGAVDARRDRLDLLLQARLAVVEEAELAGLGGRLRDRL